MTFPFLVPPNRGTDRPGGPVRGVSPKAVSTAGRSEVFCAGLFGPRTDFSSKAGFVPQNVPQDRPRLVDLYCGAVGAAKGYADAGFEVTGVDVAPQPRYPFRFVQGDALEYLAEHWREFDAIHASPPCQAFTQMSARWRGKGTKADEHPDLVTPTRRLLADLGKPYVIENVVGAKRVMVPSLLLHGAMFDLGVHRPRLFESNLFVPAPHGAPTRRHPQPIAVYGRAPDGGNVWYRNGGLRIGPNGERLYTTRSPVRRASSLEEGSRAMGINWMEWDELREAIPPAYTRWIGRFLLAAVAQEVAS